MFSRLFKVTLSENQVAYIVSQVTDRMRNQAKKDAFFDRINAASKDAKRGPGWNKRYRKALKRHGLFLSKVNPFHPASTALFISAPKANNEPKGWPDGTFLLNASDAFLVPDDAAA